MLLPWFWSRIKICSGCSTERETHWRRAIGEARDVAFKLRGTNLCACVANDDVRRVWSWCSASVASVVSRDAHGKFVHQESRFARRAWRRWYPCRSLSLSLSLFLSPPLPVYDVRQPQWRNNGVFPFADHRCSEKYKIKYNIKNYPCGRKQYEWEEQNLRKIR